MFSLLPRDTVFFDLFEGMADHGVSCARLLLQVTQEFPNIQDAIDKIRKEEHAADKLAHQALSRLDSTFITPFDREDIHALVGELDTIVDNINALAKRMVRYHVRSIQPSLVLQAQTLAKATVSLSELVHLLRKTHRLPDLLPKIREIHECENQGDENHLAAMSKLFEGGDEALEVIKWREFYLLIEAAIDDCEDAANVVERIVLKNG